MRSETANNRNFGNMAPPDEAIFYLLQQWDCSLHDIKYPLIQDFTNYPQFKHVIYFTVHL